MNIKQCSGRRSADADVTGVKCCRGSVTTYCHPTCTGIFKDDTTADAIDDGIESIADTKRGASRIGGIGKQRYGRSRGLNVQPLSRARRAYTNIAIREINAAGAERCDVERNIGVGAARDSKGRS